MIDKERLAQKCSTWNILLSGAQLDLLDRYAEILVDYNQKVNLTAITSPEGIEDRHFADSLLFAAQSEVTGKLVDVGTGAGFPGVVAKIFKPDLQLTLMEPTGKRVDFLKYLCGELGLTGVEFAKERAEEAARKIWREQFDVASARAVAALPVLCEYCLPLVRVGGAFAAIRGKTRSFVKLKRLFCNFSAVAGVSCRRLRNLFANHQPPLPCHKLVLVVACLAHADGLQQPVL